ncbi:MAG: hypothetical protein ACRC2O_05710 [Chitinophagaceae bacterium]
MDDAKIGLSEEELELVNDPQVILTKNAVIDKVYQLFGQVSLEMQQRVRPMAKELDEVMDIPPKISRGERYLELPYVILDYPRYFRPYDIFAIRTMFWWGNFFSITLHLKGNFREHYHQRIIENFEEISEGDFYAGIGTDEWEHHFGENNYISVKMIEKDEWQTLYDARDFTKIALKFPVTDFNKMEEILPEAFGKILRILEK